MKILSVFFLLLYLALPTKAQRAFSIAIADGDPVLIEIDLQTCEVCVLSEPLPAPGGGDLTMLPNGTFIGINPPILSLFSAPPTSTLLFSNNPLPNGFLGSTYDVANDLVYVTATDGLYTFNYITYTLTFIGAWPASWINPSEFIHFTNGQLYGTGTTTNPGSFDLYEIDIANPSNSTVVYSLPIGFNGQGSSQDGFYYTASSIGEFNISSQTWIQLCPFNPAFSIGTISVPTFTLPDYNCIISCFTEAGTMPSNLITECVSEVAEMNNASGVNFQSDDLLQYILFTDENDTLNTIIATSNTPNFAFDPNTMTVNTIYYVTSIVGDNDGTGNVDLNDPCLDIGENAQQLRFVPEPSVTFSVANNDICENGCKEINALFTGVPPFTLTYQVGSAPEQVLVFNTTNGNFEICIGNETGSINLQATDLSDGVCCD